MPDSYDTGGLLTSEPAVGSSQSTVSIDLEDEPPRDDDERRENLQDDGMGDGTASVDEAEAEAVPIQASGKVSIADLFKRLKPSAVRSGDVTKDVLADESTENENEDHINLVTRDDTVMTDATTSSDSQEKEEERVVIPVSSPVIEEMVMETKAMGQSSGVALKDILTGGRKKKDEQKTPVQTEAILIRDTPTPKNSRGGKKIEPHVVELLSSEDEAITVKSLLPGKERKKKNKRVKTTPNSQKEYNKSLFITLHYKPRHQRLKEIEQNMRSSSTRSVSARDMLMSFGRKKEEPVEIDGSTEQIELIEDDEFKSTEKRYPGAKSFMDVLSYRPAKPLNPISKLKELEPPTITRDQFHIIYDEPRITHRDITLPLRTPITLPQLDMNEIDTGISSLEKPTKYFTYETIAADRSTVARQNVKTLGEDPRFDRFLEMMDDNAACYDMWTDFFHPTSADDILLDIKTVRQIKIWIQNSYKLLRKRTKRHNFKKKRNADDSMDGFIVDEFDDETDDEEYTPLSIIVGPSGVGKTSVVYTLVEETAGYVYEINTSQARGKKDIEANVRELSTTQLVHQNQEIQDENEFQKGVILFEDVDILFESDKNFWSVIENTLSISRRPIILTCTDTSQIPRNIMECAMKEEALFELKKQSTSELRDYLHLAALTRGYEIDKRLLEDIISKNNRDLRKCLLEVQVTCFALIPRNSELTRVSFIDETKTSHIDGVMDLELLSQYMDTYSVADVIDQATFSHIRHDAELSEVISAYNYIQPDTIRTPILPFELNLADEMRQELPSFDPAPEKLSVDKLRMSEKHFWASKKRTARVTRRAVSNLNQLLTPSFEMEGWDNSVFELLPPSTYMEDVSPLLREHARFDQRILALNENMRLAVLNQGGDGDDDDDDDSIVVKKRNRKEKDVLPHIEGTNKFGVSPDALLFGAFASWK